MSKKHKEDDEMATLTRNVNGSFEVRADMVKQFVEATKDRSSIEKLLARANHHKENANKGK